MFQRTAGLVLDHQELLDRRGLRTGDDGAAPARGVPRLARESEALADTRRRVWPSS